MLLVVSSSVFVGVFATWRGGEWLLRRFIYENPAFAIHHLDVRTDGVIAIEQLRHWAGVKLEDNLLALDLARVKRDLEFVPAIESAAVERVLPHTLRIRVTEREPTAQFLFPQVRADSGHGGGVYTFDAKGYVMLPLEPQQRSIPTQTNDRLPLLVGVPLADLRPGRRAESPQVLAALQFIEAFERSALAGVVELKHIDVSLPTVLQVITVQGSEVTFGLNDPDGQLRRWRAVYDYGQKAGKYVAFLDLSVSNNVPARWVEASLVPPVAPRAIQPFRSKRKNV